MKLAFSDDEKLQFRKDVNVKMLEELTLVRPRFAVTVLLAILKVLLDLESGVHYLESGVQMYLKVSATMDLLKV